MAVRLCLEPRCPDVARYRGRCATHARDRERTTHPNRHIYNSARWRYLRRHQLVHHPLCGECGRMATDVDHVTPIEQGGAIWAKANLRSLCKGCHSRKTRREQGATHAT